MAKKTYTAGTYTAKPSQVERAWHVVDATDLIVGRAAAQIANILRGKTKPTYTPNIDCGDYVIVINADKVKFTGNKLDDKVFYWHTNHPGGIKQRTMREIFRSKYPERVLQNAVRRMMPKVSPLARSQFSRLMVYSGNEHPHLAQRPVALDLAARNIKNLKRSV